MGHRQPVLNGCLRAFAGVARVAFAAAAGFILGSAPGAAQPVQGDAPVIARFQSAVADYAALHRRLEVSIEPIVVTADLQIITRGIDAMAAAMRAARPDARQGDLFTPEMATILRVRVKDALLAHGLTVEDVRAAALEDMAGSRGVLLPVNGTFPWHAASTVPACVFEALPDLPPDLEYRLVGRDMVLVDLHASLIVDVLRNVMGDAGTR
jgi:hypothetical protein